MSRFAKKHDVLWPVVIKEMGENKDGELEVFGTISGTDRDRDKQWVNQDTLAKQWDHYKNNGILMYMHSWITPIGTVTDYDRSGDDSIAQVRFGKGYNVPMPVQMSGVKLHMDDVRAMVEQRIVKSFSIAFDADAVEEHEDPAQKGRLDVTDWYETSLVTIPSFRRAQMFNSLDSQLESMFKMFIRYLGDERIKQWYMGIDAVPNNSDEDPAIVEMLDALNKATRGEPDTLSEAQWDELRRLELETRS